MQFSQSRNSKRGALIAVIKIEIDAQRADRIFLHQNDDDYKLAQQFVEKNRVNPSFTQHIYQRIVFSRHSVEEKQANIIASPAPTATPFTPTPLPQTRGQPQALAKHVTPYNNLVSHRDQQQYQLSQSFGQLLKKGNNQTTQNVPSLFQTNDDQTFTQNKRDTFVQTKKILQAPIKKLFDNKQFKLYIDEDSDTNKQLFETQKKQESIKVYHSPLVDQRQSYNSVVSSNPSNKIQEYLQQRQSVSDYLKKCQSLQKCQTTANLKSIPYAQKNERMNKTIKKADLQKPLHVKILKKDQLLSMNQSLKKSMSKQQISRINKDVTSRLYNEADIRKNYLNIIKQKAKKEKQLLQDVQLTHRPEINPISKVIAEGRRKKQTPIQSYLIEEGKKVEQRRQEQQGKRHLKQIENCTFEPQLNLISRKLAQERSKFDSKISQAKYRRSTYRDQNMFHPSLNRVTYELMKNRGKFEDRQRDFLEHRNNKLVLEVRKKRDGQKIDCETGQQLFRPKIHDIGVRASLGPKIGDYLYQLGRKSDSPKQQPSCRPSISQQSENLANQLYSRRISWIFSELDSDQDGIISPQKVSISTIPTELLQIIKPILFQLQEINEALNLTQFRNAVQILHKKLSPYEKNILYYSKITL